MGGDSALHYQLIHGLIEDGACPANSDLAARLGISEAGVQDSLRSLSDIHGVVLHPHICEPWIVHPFSLTPTLNWVEGHGKGWWAPCIWCAFGVAALVTGEVRIHTRIAGEAEPLAIPVKDGLPAAHGGLYVHFAIPPAKAWQNVHEHCAMVLPFRAPADIRAWSERHRLPYGQAVPLSQVAELARVWYGSHANPDWRKWSVEEAQQIFRNAGLDSEFWDLGARSGKF